MSGLHAFLGARDTKSAEKASQNIETQRRIQAKMNAMGIATTISERTSLMPSFSQNQNRISNMPLPPKGPSTNISKTSRSIPGSTQTASELRPSNHHTDSHLALRCHQQNPHDPFDTDIEGFDDTTTLSDAVQSSTRAHLGLDPNNRYQADATRQSEGAGNEENGVFGLGSNVLESDMTEEVDDGNSALDYEELKGDGNVQTTLRPINDRIAAGPSLTASNEGNFQIQPKSPNKDLSGKWSAEEIAKMSFDQLLQEPFDYDTSSEHLIDEPELANKSLEHRLHGLFEQPGAEDDLRKQRQAFFSSLSIEDFEECGDLLIQKFTSLVHKYKKARQHRRHLARQLEQEIQVHESLISKRAQNVDNDFVRLKKAGENVVKGKVL
ncbi:MAG: hypothetical protein Q9167_003128 [Letrouitia subvulpina]